MRLSSLNNQFIFNLPESFIDKELEQKFQKILDMNLFPYDSVMSFINSTIKDIVFPSLSFETVQQTTRYGKKVNYKEAGNILDKFQSEIDINFISVESHLNYSMLMEMCVKFYLKPIQYIDSVNFQILDKSGNLIYTIVLREVLINSLSENRFAYYHTEFSEQTFSLTIKYNYIDIYYELDDGDKTIFDISDELNEPDPRDMRKLEKAYNDRMLK